MKPDLLNQGCANAYVFAGNTPKERSRRLTEVPENNQLQARQHTQTVLAIRNHHRKTGK